MPKEWIDVADTAIKIGLGSLITGAFTYIGIKVSKNFERDRFMLEHKINLLQKSVEDADVYFEALNSYNSLIAGISKIKEQRTEGGSAFSKSQREEITLRDKALLNSWKSCDYSISKLRLIDSIEASESLKKCKEIVLDFRNSIAFEGNSPTYEQVENYREILSNAKKEFHNNTASVYSGK